MKILHIADLHFGKSLHGRSLIDSGDQDFWVDRFLELAENEKPDAVVIAGDVYDRSAPSGEAVALFGRMLTGMADRRIPVLTVAGNHDSAKRLAFAGPLLAAQGVYISEPLTAPLLRHVTLQDAFGPVTFWLMPYVFPALIAQALGEEEIRSYDGAVRALLARQPIDFTQRNVLIAHQNVTANGAEVPRGGSETTVGGVGQIDYTAFDGFDYAALGHIHASYPVGREAVRYAGSPLCYHFDELRQPEKGALRIVLGEKGTKPAIDTLALPALHPMREIRGSYEDLKAAELAAEHRGEYLRVAVTDRRMAPEILDFFRRLCEERGSVLMECVSEYQAFREKGGEAAARTQERTLAELFGDFYTDRSGEVLSEKDEALLQAAEEELAGGLWREDAKKAAESGANALLALLLKQEESHETA